MIAELNHPFPHEACMAPAVHGTTNEGFVVDCGPLSDSEIEKLEGPALRGLLNNQMTSEMRKLAEDFAAYGNAGMDALLDHFNGELGKFWSPYRIRVERDEEAITINLMRMENGRLQPSGPSIELPRLL
jgi:hypothetical protein